MPSRSIFIVGWALN